MGLVLIQKLQVTGKDQYGRYLGTEVRRGSNGKERTIQYEVISDQPLAGDVCVMGYVCGAFAGRISVYAIASAPAFQQAPVAQNKPTRSKKTAASSEAAGRKAQSSQLSDTTGTKPVDAEPSNETEF